MIQIDDEYRAVLVICVTEFESMLKERILANCQKEIDGQTQPNFFENCIVNDCHLYERVREMEKSFRKK